MGQKPRPKPKYLATKLRTIRERLGLSQSEMAHLLNSQLTPARISEYESGTREPNLLVLLAYARAARISVDQFIDDNLDLDE